MTEVKYVKSFRQVSIMLVANDVSIMLVANDVSSYKSNSRLNMTPF